MLNFKKRVREISMKNSSLTGIVNSGQVKKPIQFESSLERDFIFLLEFDLSVDHYLEQPLIIPFKDKQGKQRKYIPDFAVSFHSERPIEIIEIKYEETLKKQHESLEPKFKAAERFCKKRGYSFKVITEDYIRNEKGTELDNFKFLSRYRDYFSNLNQDQTAFPPFNTDLSVLRKAIIKINKCSVRELVEHCAQDTDKQAELIFLTWYLIATNFVSTDFSIKLNLDSTIWHN